jgi:adenosylhomocysteine nucleosidase
MSTGGVRGAGADGAGATGSSSAAVGATGSGAAAAVTASMDPNRGGAPVSHRPLGILAALPQELGDLIEAMRAESGVRTITHGQRDYHLGTVHGAPCTVPR